MPTFDSGDALFASVRPLLATDTVTRLTLSTSSAATTNVVAKGVYVVRLNAASGLCFAAQAASVTLPTSAADATTGVALADGEVMYFDGTTKLAAILTAGTGELAITKIS